MESDTAEGGRGARAPRATLDIAVAADSPGHGHPAASDTATANDSTSAPSNTRGNLGIGLGAAGLLVGAAALVVALRRPA